MADTPNILLIISDQQRSDTLGFMGQTPCRTPNIDALMQRGVSYNRAITPAPICGPARTAIFTGQYPHQVPGAAHDTGPLTTGEFDAGANNMLLNDYSCRAEPVLTQRLKERGYHTSCAGKWHLGNDVIHDWFDEAWGYDNQQYVDWCSKQGLPDGWALNDPATRTHRSPRMTTPRAAAQAIEPAHGNDAWICDQAIEHIRSRSGEQPFFSVCSMNGPHPPFVIPEPYYSIYDPASVPEPPNFGPQAGEPACNRQNFYRQLYQDHGEDWAAWKKSVAVYWGFCTWMDDQVGRLTECLQEEGVLDDTLIIFCSDHGEMLGQHGLWHKMTMYEEALRVPLVLAGPGVQGRGLQSNAPASLLDLSPTILAAAGIAAPAAYGGLSLLDPHQLPQRTLFAEQKPLGEWHGAVDLRMLLDGSMKYIWNRGDREELYDLNRDPMEQDNLANRTEIHPYREGLHAWMRQTGDPLAAVFA